MAASTTLCEPCSERHLTKPSAYWCTECEEAICDDCQEHHKVLKATRSHELITIDKFKSLPSFITDIQQSCTYHNEKYQQYCVTHALPICFKCIKEHQKCNVIPLDEVTNNTKISVQLKDLETRLMDLLQNLERIQKDRKANLVSIEERKELHLAEIQQIRNQIIEHLDKLEKELKQDLEKKECQSKKNIQKILSSVKEKENLITEYQTNLQSIKQHGSNLQTFLVIRDIEVKVFENEQYLQSLVENNQLDQVNLTCKADPVVLSILDSLKLFGSIEIQTTSSSIRLVRQKEKQAQLQVKLTKTIKDLKLILTKKFTTDGGNVRGCCMSVNGDYLFIDKHLKKLTVIASDGTFKYNTLPSRDGFDITLIDEKTVAITSGDSKKHIGIDIIDIISRKKIKFINLPGHPFGITRDQDSLFVCVKDHGIYTVNTRDYTTSHLISCYLPWGSYVYVFANKLYYSDATNHSVYCFNRNGSRVWTFQDTSVLDTPNGITVDDDGNVFVVGEESSNVVIISHDGKFHKEILTEEDGLYQPSCIFFNKKDRKLLVANIRQTSFLYNVT